MPTTIDCDGCHGRKAAAITAAEAAIAAAEERIRDAERRIGICEDTTKILDSLTRRLQPLCTRRISKRTSWADNKLPRGPDASDLGGGLRTVRAPTGGAKLARST
jgi:hypothetical protein